MHAVPNVAEAALAGVSIDAPVLEEVGGRRAVDDLAVGAVVVLPDGALGVSAGAIHVSKSERALALVIQGIVHFAKCAYGHGVAAHCSRECIGWAGTRVNVLVPNPPVGAGDLGRDANLVGQYFSPRAIAGFRCLIPFLARLAGVGNTKQSIPDSIERTLTTP